jgi:geranylgeranyl pyrophosphate synthase
MTIDLLYGDHEGGQRTMSCFHLSSRERGLGGLCIKTLERGPSRSPLDQTNIRERSLQPSPRFTWEGVRRTRSRRRSVRDPGYRDRGALMAVREGRGFRDFHRRSWSQPRQCNEYRIPFSGLAEGCIAKSKKRRNHGGHEMKHTVGPPDLATIGLSADARFRHWLSQGLQEVEVTLARFRPSTLNQFMKREVAVPGEGTLRVRSLLVLVSGSLGNSSDPRLIQAAAALELVFLAFYFQDDLREEMGLLRQSDPRRIKEHQAASLLMGDYLASKASLLAAQLGAWVSSLFARTVAALSEGQILELKLAERLDLALSTYEEIARLKTAALTGAACRLGSMLAGASPDAVSATEEFGEVFGVALHFSDDIVQSVHAGSESSGGIRWLQRESSTPLPLILSLQDPETREELGRLLASRALPQDKLDRVTGIIKEGHMRVGRRIVAKEVAKARSLALGLAPSRASDAFVQLTECVGLRCGVGLRD